MTTTTLPPVAARNPRRMALVILSRYGTLIGLALMLIAFTIRAPTVFPTEQYVALR